MENKEILMQFHEMLVFGDDFTPKSQQPNPTKREFGKAFNETLPCHRHFPSPFYICTFTQYIVAYQTISKEMCTIRTHC